MTEPTDDLLSAVLDGEATEAERARVGADGELSARLEELRAVRAAIGANPPQPDPAARGRAVAAALAAAATTAGADGDDEAELDGGPPAPPVALPPSPFAPVTPLRARRPRQRWLAAGAAAAVLVAGVAVASVLASRNNGDTVSTVEAERDATDGATAAGGAPPVEAAPSTTAGPVTQDAGRTSVVAPTASGSSALPDLGAVDAASLPGALTELFAAPAADATVAATPCATAVPATRPIATATWNGAAALVLVPVESASRAVVVLIDGCSPVAEVPLT